MDHVKSFKYLNDTIDMLKGRMDYRDAVGILRDRLNKLPLECELDLVSKRMLLRGLELNKNTTSKSWKESYLSLMTILYLVGEYVSSFVPAED